MPKTSANAEREMDGVEKAAILLIALGPEKSIDLSGPIHHNHQSSLSQFLSSNATASGFSSTNFSIAFLVSDFS
jgi:flagellar motor switch protein FliG